MKFGKLSPDQAQNTIVLESVPYGEDDPHGHGRQTEPSSSQPILTVVDANQGNTELRQAGVIGVDAAVVALVDALVANPTRQGVIVKHLGAGHVNIIAQRPGLLQLDPARITQVGKIAPSMTCATLPNLTRAMAGTVVASIKVVSNGVSDDSVTRACVAVRQGQTEALHIRAAVRTTATLIETLHPGGRIAPSGRRVLDERLDRLGATLAQVNDIPHTQDAVAQAIKEAKGDVIILLTASPTADIDDLAPSALRQAGGDIEQFGMPVHPGYGLFLGNYNERPVLGLPASARALALNGADWVLERLVCGLRVSGDDIAAMSVGGLLNGGYERGHLTG